MKFITITVFTVVIFASAYASFTTDSTVNNECDTGCNSRLSLSVSARGTARTVKVARKLCKDDCFISDQDASQVCEPLCGILPKVPFQRLSQPETCVLCNANAGEGIAACLAAVKSVQTTCKQVCGFGTFRPTGERKTIFGSATITQDFPGAGCN